MDTSWGALEVRVPGPEDINAFETLVALARVPVEAPLINAINSGQAASLLLGAAKRGDRTGLMQAADRVQGDENLIPFFCAVSLPLIAVTDDHSVVGALQGIVPGNVAMDLLRRGASTRSVAAFALTAGKISAVAVRPDAVRGGIGTALIREAVRIYSSAQYRLIYGYLRNTDPTFLKDFYTEVGFGLSDHTRTRSVTIKGFGVVHIGANSDQLMFYRRINLR